MAEIIWLLEDAVKAIHQRQIAEHGGTPGLRDEVAEICFGATSQSSGVQ